MNSYFKIITWEYNTMPLVPYDNGPSPYSKMTVGQHGGYVEVKMPAWNKDLGLYPQSNIFNLLSPKRLMPQDPKKSLHLPLTYKRWGIHIDTHSEENVP